MSYNSTDIKDIMRTEKERRPLELLSPAKDFETGRQAILHGADAVYIGARSFGARVKAANSVEDIRRLVDFASPYGVKIYVTLNTILFDNELLEAEKLIRELYNVGVDALIVQDLAILKLDIPPIALHASTQCDIRDVAKAKFMQNLGFSQIVIARECTLDETAEICRSVTIPVETFVHGALCVSYSGDCRASYSLNGRSANRGNCAQICRLPFDLVDGKERTLLSGKHLLSLRDLNRMESLGDFAKAGVTSFKIEGRLKDIAYVKNVTAAYRDRIDKLISEFPDKYFRPSRGVARLSFAPDLNKSFNRSYTEYFRCRQPSEPIAQINTPKWMGEYLGRVEQINAKGFTISSNQEISGGDGLSYMKSTGETGGFRANSFDGKFIYPFGAVNIVKGDKIFRNIDKKWEDILNNNSAIRKIPIEIKFSVCLPDKIILSAEIQGIGPTVVSSTFDLQSSDKDSTEPRRNAVSKLGETPFELAKYEDCAGSVFVPLKIVTQLRRELTETLIHILKIHKSIELRRVQKHDLEYRQTLTFHDNVANTVSRKFYESLGATVAQPAMELAMPSDATPVVMTSRYCLRRELGACLKSPEGSKIIGPLTLINGNTGFALEFDCKRCQMNVLLQKKVR